MMPFSQLPAVKKTPFLVQLKQIFGPSYVVTALQLTEWTGVVPGKNKITPQPHSL